MPRYGDKSLAETVGEAVLFPFKAILVILLVPFLIIAYPLIGIYILLRGEGTLWNRIKLAVGWPLSLLAFNELLSLGGYNNRTLSRITNWLNGRFGNGEGKWLG